VVDRYREGIRLATDNRRRAGYQNNLAYVLADSLQESLPEAKQLAEAATTAEPDNAVYVDTLAWVHYRLKDYSEAERIQRQALSQRVPGSFLPMQGAQHHVLRYHMGAILEALGKKDAAVAEYRQAIDLARRVSPAEARESLPQAQAALRRLTGQG
jgi:tetratricopeptide (TPR) repeat protein